MKPYLLLLVILICQPLISQPDQENQAGGRDGYFWTGKDFDLSRNEKQIYVMGLVDFMFSTGQDRFDTTLNRKFTVDQIVSALDEFYSDYKNLAIKTTDAFYISLYTLNGRDEQAAWLTRYARADDATRRIMERERPQQLTK